VPFFILSILIQVCLVIHILKTGRPTIWIWVVVLLPMAGTIAYVIMEILPELMGTRTGRRAVQNISKTINPNKDLNRASFELERADTVENNMRLADEFLARNQFAEAKALYEKCLRGVHATDPAIMAGLAKAEFGLGEFATAKTILDRLIETNPNYKNESCHLLYARALEILNDIPGAEHEYQALAKYYSGPEAKYRYALLCKRTGKTLEAKKLLEEILSTFRTSGKHYEYLHKEWLGKVKEELNQI
jgi:hypothetical protein